MIVLFNPLSTTPGKQPLPLSLLSLAAVLDGRMAWRLVDGNIERDPAAAILAAVDEAGDRGPKMLAATVMPGPQLTQAVAVCRQVRAVRPGLPIVWGGYFPTQHADTVLGSPFVDFVVRSQGERAIVELIDTLAHGGALSDIASLSWKRGEEIIHNPLAGLVPLDDLPNVPYAEVPMARYLHRNYLGQRTVAYNSSFGCPFACGFCAVGAMAHRRWLAQSPERISKTLDLLQSRYGVDAVQMHDMDFFISEARTAEFAGRVARLGIHWWGLGRTDTLMAYSDDTWRAMARSGLKMIFSGAESGSAEQLAAMTKGGRSSPSITLELARRMRDYRIVPEFSFVLGCPPDPLADVEVTFEFIRRLKIVNPSTEVVLYTYTPVPMDGLLYEAAQQSRFAFPGTLDEWATPRWERLSMRRGDGIPWMKGAVRRRVRNFERVINAFYPTVTDPELAGWHRAVLKAASSWRYALKWYDVPYELQALHRLIRYQRPETTGF
jgi:anaerobic magnesium-protoporphyrin IX monomethyl ester cyclase